MKNILISVVILFSVNTVSSAVGVDSFLNEGVSVKGETIGGTYIGVENAVSVINYNPAAANLIKNKNIEINYNGNTVSDINNIMVGYGEKINNRISYGISIMRKAIGGYEGYGSDMTGTGIVIDSKEIGFSAGAGINIIGRLSGGIGIKVLSKDIGGYSGTGFGIDAGIYWRRENRIKHSIIENLIYNIEGGCAVKNIVGPEIKLRNEIEKEPMELRVGIGYTFDLLNLVVNRSGVRIIAEGIYRDDVQEMRYVYGLELMIVKEVSLFGGYGKDMYRAGISVNIGNMEFNYGYKISEDLGGTHNIGINIMTGNIKDERMNTKSKKKEDRIADMIESLPEKERKIIKEYYFNGLDKYYKDDKIGAIAEWRKINTDNRELADKIYKLINKVQDELLK